METPSTKNSTIEESVQAEAVSVKRLQWVVASSCFQGKENGRFGFVMVQNDENYDGIEVFKARRMSVQLAQALVSLILYKKDSFKCLEKSFSRPSLAKEMRNSDSQDVEELHFTQCFGELSEEKLKVDKTDKILECFCIRWYRTSDNPEKCSARKEYRLTPIGAIRDTVSPVQGNTMLHVMDKAESRVTIHSSMCDWIDDWEL